MKIAMLSYLVFGDSIGGVENHIKFMSEELKKMGHVVEVFKPVWEEDYINASLFYDEIKINYINVGKRPKIMNSLIVQRIPFARGFLSK